MTPEGELLQKHLEAAVAELKLEIGNPLAIQMAALKAAHDLCQVRIAEGSLAAVDHLIKLDPAMTEIRKLVPAEPVSIQIEFVGGTQDHVCRACGAEHFIEPTCTKCGFRQHGDLVRWREEKAAAPGVAEAPVAQAGKPTADVPAAAVPAVRPLLLLPPYGAAGEAMRAPHALPCQRGRRQLTDAGTLARPRNSTRFAIRDKERRLFLHGTATEELTCVPPYSRM
jgi:hypothetical protein